MKEKRFAIASNANVKFINVVMTCSLIPLIFHPGFESSFASDAREKI